MTPSAPDRKPEPCISRIPIRVRYAETDKMGVVYHGRYLEWFEMGRVDLMKATGLCYRTIESHGLAFPVTEIWSRYRESCTFDDELELESWYLELTGVRITFGYQLTRGDRTLAEAISVHATLGRDRRLEPLPGDLRRKIEPHVIDRGYGRSHLNRLMARRESRR